MWKCVFYCLKAGNHSQACVFARACVCVCFLSSAIIAAMNAIFLSSRTHASTSPPPPPGSITVSFYVCPHTHAHSFHLVLPHRCSSPPPSSSLLSGLFLWRFSLISYQTDESGNQERSLCPAGWRRCFFFFLHEKHVLKWLSKGNKFMPLLTCCCPVCFVFFMHLVVLKLLHRDTAFMLVWNNTFYFVLEQIIKSFLHFLYFYCIFIIYLLYLTLHRHWIAQISTLISHSSVLPTSNRKRSVLMLLWIL